MILRNIFLLVILLSPGFILSQIGREFKSTKVNGDVTKATELSYQDLKLDNEGKPILPKKSMDETIHIYEKGYPIEAHNFQTINDKKELSIKVLLKREKGVITTAHIYNYSFGKESLLRSHTAKIKDDKIVSEIIHDEDGKEIGSATYEYGINKKGVTYEKILLNGNRGVGHFYKEEDENGILLSAQIMKRDTAMIMKRIEVHGDSIRRYHLVQNNSYTNKVDSILFVERTWFDSIRNPILGLQQMTAITDPPPGEPSSTNFVSAFTYSNEKIVEKPTSPISDESIYGAWRNKKYNIELFFEPPNNDKQRMFGSSFWSKSNEPTVQEYLDSGQIWKFMLKQDLYASWSIKPNGQLTITLKNESVLTFNMTIEHKTLVLTPDMKDMKGTLRLTQSN